MSPKLRDEGVAERPAGVTTLKVVDMESVLTA